MRSRDHFQPIRMQLHEMPSPGDHIHGWMSGPELHWLCETARGMRSVVEIGSWRGRSTFALCTSGCPIVFAVDHFRGSAEHQSMIREEHLDLRSEFQANVGHFKNLMVIEMTSAEASQHVGTVDMVFIDASHDKASVAQDLQLWAPKARKLIAGHDFTVDGVGPAVTEHFGRVPDLRCDSIWAMIVPRGDMADTPTDNALESVQGIPTEEALQQTPEPEAEPVAPPVSQGDFRQGGGISH